MFNPGTLQTAGKTAPPPGGEFVSLFVTTASFTSVQIH